MRQTVALTTPSRTCSASANSRVRPIVDSREHFDDLYAWDEFWA